MQQTATTVGQTSLQKDVPGTLVVKNLPGIFFEMYLGPFPTKVEEKKTLPKPQNRSKIPPQHPNFPNRKIPPKYACRICCVFQGVFEGSLVLCVGGSF